MACLLVLGGLLYLLLPEWQAASKRREGERVNTVRLQRHVAEAAVFAEPSTNLGTPLELQIRRLNLTLPVRPGKYHPQTQEWALDRQHVFYVSPGTFPLMSDAPPLFYGHNIRGVLQPLEGIASDELLEVRTADGRILSFRYVSDRIVQPAEGDALNEKRGKNVIALLTCDGPRFEQRRILYFTYVGTRNAPEAVRQ